METQTMVATASAEHCPVCGKNLRVTRAESQVREGEQVFCCKACHDLAPERLSAGSEGRGKSKGRKRE